jgi:hypothetical protein
VSAGRRRRSGGPGAGLDDRRTAVERLGELVATTTDHARLVRGIELADDGRVHDLDVVPGRVSAIVSGSRRDPYRVTVRLTVAVPPRSPSHLRYDCTCPDWGNPCKHGVAVVLALGEELDADPSLARRFWGAGPDVSGSPATPATRPARPLVPPAGLPDPADRPDWAEPLPRPLPPTTVDAFFGIPARVRAAGPSLSPPNPAALLELGPLPVAGSAVDLAPALRSLLAHLADG